MSKKETAKQNAKQLQDELRMNIKRKRLSMGLSQLEFAQMLGLTDGAQICRIERGGGDMHLWMFLLLSAVVSGP